jgi:hypothetical protein
LSCAEKYLTTWLMTVKSEAGMALSVAMFTFQRRKNLLSNTFISWNEVSFFTSCIFCSQISADRSWEDFSRSAATVSLVYPSMLTGRT